MTGVRRTSDAVAKAVFVARALTDGSLVGESTGQELHGVGYGWADSRHQTRAPGGLTLARIAGGRT